ncbi:hypothetical protein CISG_00523 [Coccidioides immitis RMSCC 3703]|uniref:Uncharacterized protein n=1 Tax=Coccidioides immitis RMSCC 3703 TaxID=454286 RepID=A0A0J8QIM9_COCIT|nr:hypothetical protein CISG_00523 [Coccidioides immitis RMSCC 3703]
MIETPPSRGSPPVSFSSAFGGTAGRRALPTGPPVAQPHMHVKVVSAIGDGDSDVTAHRHGGRHSALLLTLRAAQWS